MRKKYSKEIEPMLTPVLGALDFSLNGKNDVFFTSSFGYQSELLFFLLEELSVQAKCLFIKSPLSNGGIEEHKDYILNKYTNFEIHEIDRTEWTESQLKGRNFFEIADEERKTICRALKRGPLIDFIETHSMKTWVSGIRRDQTSSRSELNFIEITDLNVIKLSPMFLWRSQEVEFLTDVLKLKTNDLYQDYCKLNEKSECGLHL